MLPQHKSTLDLDISRIIDFDMFKGFRTEMLFVQKSIYLLPCFLGTPMKIKTNVYAAPAWGKKGMHWVRLQSKTCCIILLA